MIEPVEKVMPGNDDEANSSQGLDHAREGYRRFSRRAVSKQRDDGDQRNRSEILEKQDGKSESTVARGEFMLLL